LANKNMSSLQHTIDDNIRELSACTIQVSLSFSACVCSRCLTDMLKTGEMDRRIVGRGGVKRSKYIVPCFLLVEVSCRLV